MQPSRPLLVCPNIKWVQFAASIALHGRNWLKEQRAWPPDSLCLELRVVGWNTYLPLSLVAHFGGRFALGYLSLRLLFFIHRAKSSLPFTLVKATYLEDSSDLPVNLGCQTLVELSSVLWAALFLSLTVMAGYRKAVVASFHGPMNWSLLTWSCRCHHVTAQSVCCVTVDLSPVSWWRCCLSTVLHTRPLVDIDCHEHTIS